MPVTASNNGTFTVGDWRVEPASDRIARGTENTYLRPQVMDVLDYLARHRGQVVSTDEPLDNLWSGKVAHRRPHFLPRAEALLFQAGSWPSIVQSESEIRLLDLRSGEQTRLVQGVNPRYANGRILFERIETGGYSLWSVGFDLDKLAVTGLPAPLITDPIEKYDVSRSGSLCPVWSADGRRIAYYRQDQGVFYQALDLSVSPTRLVPFKGLAYPLQWTDDGLLYGQVNPLSNGDFYYQPNGGHRVPIETTEAISLHAEISPDGRWIAYSQQEGSHPGVFVGAFPDAARRWPVSPGSNPKWSADGTKLYFESFNYIKSVAVSNTNPPAFAPPENEFEFSGEANITFDSFDVSSDGKRFVIVNVIYGDPPAQIYVNNWRQLLPDGS